MQNELIIEAGRTERHYWRDLWRYSRLFSLRDLHESPESGKALYRQTSLNDVIFGRNGGGLSSCYYKS